MKLEIHIANGELRDQVDEFIRDRLNLVVGRFQDRLAGIEVRLRDTNAQKGGEDKFCSIDAHLVPRGVVHVQATETNVQEAITKAVHRLESVVAKTVDRGHNAANVRHQQGRMRQESRGN